MKKILLLSLSIFLLGCLKTDLPTTTSVGEWVLIDAKLYIKRWGNYPLKKYDYFTLTQNTNCLDLTGNSIKLDEIVQYETNILKLYYMYLNIFFLIKKFSDLPVYYFQIYYLFVLLYP